MSRKLTKEIIINRVGSDKLDSIKSLNLWGNNLDDITLISEMPSLEILSLSSNQIKDIKVLKHLKNLKELYLKDNKISDFNQVEFLKNCKKLEILNLSENPISYQQNYRQKILEILPNLKKLDDVENTNNNFQHNKFSFHKNPFMLFKKIFNNTSNNLLNKSFQKKKNLGTFKIGNKIELNKNKNLNLDLSLDNNEIKYNKKIVGNYKQLSHMKNYQSTMLSSYQEFDEPIKNEKNNNETIKINEDVVIQSIKILLGVLNLNELNCVNDDIKNLLKEKNK